MAKQDSLAPYIAMTAAFIIVAASMGRRRRPSRGFIDIRESLLGVERPKFSSGLVYKGKPGAVPPEDRSWVVAHNTAVEFGTTSAAEEFWKERLMESGKSEAEAKAEAPRYAKFERFWDTPYHVVVTKDGDVLYVNDVSWHTYHAGPANRASVGIAVEGNFPYDEAKRTSEHTVLTPKLREAASRGLSVLVDLARRAGYRIDTVVAHSQLSGNRTDPGEIIWREVIRPTARRLGLSLPEDEAWYDGKPIPGSWRYDYS